MNFEIHRDDEGRLHCVDGPAVLWKDGSQSWWFHGKLHRLDGPAVIVVIPVDATPLRVEIRREMWWMMGEELTNNYEIEINFSLF